MAVKLRLMRMGKKKQPTYRVVAADSRSPRNGRFIEIVGTYEPRARAVGRHHRQRQGRGLAAQGRPAHRDGREAAARSPARGTQFKAPAHVVSDARRRLDDDRDDDLDDDARRRRTGSPAADRRATCSTYLAQGDRRRPRRGRDRRSSEGRRGSLTSTCTSRPATWAGSSASGAGWRRSIRTVVRAAGACATASRSTSTSSTELARTARRLLEVGRIVKPHGLRGEVVVDARHRPHRACWRPGSVLARPSGPLEVRASTPHQAPLDRGLRRRRPTATQAEALRGATLSAEPHRRPRRAVGARADRRRGRRRRRASTHGRVAVGRGQPGQRPARARRRARWCRCVFVVEHVRRTAWWSTRPTACSTDRDGRADRRLHDLPATGRRRSLARACSARPGATGCSTSACTTCAAHHRPPPLGRRRAVRRRRRHGARCPSRSSPRSRRSRRRARCSCSDPAGARFDQALARELAAGDGLLAAVRPLRGRRRAGARPPRRRRAVGRRLRAGRRRGGRHGGARGGRPAGARA